MRDRLVYLSTAMQAYKRNANHCMFALSTLPKLLTQTQPTLEETCRYGS